MILVIINFLIKIAHNKLIKTTIYKANFVKVIINIVIQYYNLLKIIISNRN